MPQVNSQPNQSDRSDSTAILDSALLRAGRFDRPITVSPPDQQGRLTILQVHTQSVPLRDPSDLEAIAASTPRMVGADLRNLVNEAALSAVRQGEEAVSPGVRPRTGHLAGPKRCSNAKRLRRRTPTEWRVCAAGQPVAVHA